MQNSNDSFDVSGKNVFKKDLLFFLFQQVLFTVYLMRSMF